MPTPPSAPKRPHELEAHGDVRVDDWYWLRSDTKDDPEVLAHLDAENAYVKEALAHTDHLQLVLFEEIKARIQETDLGVPYRKGAWWWYSRTEEGQQYEITCRRRGDLDATEEVVLDENALAGSSPYFSLGAFDASPNQQLLLYSTDFDGNELYTLKVRDLGTGADLADSVEGTYYGTAWADDRTFFYSRTDEAMRPHQIWRHTLGTPSAEDVLIFDETDERFFISVHRSKSDRFVMINTGSKMTDEWWVLPVDDPTGEFRCVHPREHGVEYSVYDAPSAAGDRFLIVTNEGDAINSKLVEAPTTASSRAEWVDLEPHRLDVKLEGVGVSARHYVLFERADALRRIVVVRIADGERHTIEMPEEVYSAGDGGNPEYDTDTLRFVYTSLVTPRSVYDYDLETRTRTLKKRTEVLGGYDPAAYESGRLWATGDDGTKVPMSFLRKVGVETPGPVLLYGYGSYEASIDPGFSSLRLSLVDRGFTFVIAHVRGGGELGRPWYEQGRLLNKRNTFTDFIACADHLVETGWTTPKLLVARGGSAGGLLMGAVANLRPHLFAAVVAEVPFVDSLTTILDESLPLTVTEWEEWGNPVESQEVYEYMRSYDPYTGVRATEYPAILATAGLNDPRVSYWEPAKWVQRLRERSTGDAPVYLKTEMGAGHGGPSGRYDAWRDEAFVTAFVLDALGMTDAQP